MKDAQECLIKVLRGPPEIHMEILCGSGLSLCVMKQGWPLIVSQGLYLDADTRCWNQQHAEPQAEAIDDFWPEVSSRYSLENPRPMNPDNAQGRVLAEIF